MANAFALKPLPISAIANSGTAAGYAAANVTNDYAGVLWRSSVAGGGGLIYFIVDLGADITVNTLMLFGLAGLVTSGGSAAVYIKLATNAQGPTFAGSSVNTGLGTGNCWADPTGYPLVIDGAVTGKNIFLWERPSTDISPPAVRYIAISFFTLNTNDFIEIARIAVGKRFQPERNFSFGGGPGVKDLGTLDFSARAVLMRRRAKKLRTISLSFSNLHKDEVVASARPLLEYMGNTEMIAVCTDPTVDADLQNRCYFGPHVGDLGLTWRKADCWETKLNLVSIF